MRSIKLTEYGETLLKYPGSDPTDETEMFLCIGVHSICNGFIDIKNVSNTHNILLCRGCGLRIVIPKETDTFGKLREHIHKTLKARR